MFSGIAKRLALGLQAAGVWAFGAAVWVGRRVGEGSYERFWRWYLRLSLRVAVLSMVLGVCAIHWNWTRLQTDGRLSDALLRDVVAERQTLRASEGAPLGSREPGRDEMIRCFVPVGAGAVGLAAYLNPQAQASASAWIEPALPWLGNDWWVIDVMDRRILKMSRMDSKVLLPHPRMRETQCVPTHAMKLINAGVNDLGQQTFQVIDLSRSQAPY